MTDQELRRLSRKDLLALLLAQGREKESITAELEAAKAALSARELIIAQSGSIAEAALKLNGVFEAAQKAADEYLENIRTKNGRTEQACAKQEEASQKACENMLAASRAKCETLEQETSEACAKQKQETEEACKKLALETTNACNAKKQQTEQLCQKMEEEAKRKADAYWANLSERLHSFYKDHEALKELLIPLEEAHGKG